MTTAKMNMRPLRGHPYANARIAWANGGEKECLISYSTVVAHCTFMETVQGVRPAFLICGWYSKTTSKHIRYWLDDITARYGLPAVPVGVVSHAARIAGCILWDTAAECWRCRKGVNDETPR